MVVFTAVIVGISRYGMRVINYSGKESRIENAKDLEDQRKYGEAIAIYETLIRLDPNEFEARERLARIYLRTGRIPDALDAAIAGLEIATGGDRLPFAVLVGDAELASGEWDDARAAYEAAVEIAPECGEAYFGVAQACRATQDFPAMVEALAQAGDFGLSHASEGYEERWRRTEKRVQSLRRSETERSEDAVQTHQLARAYVDLGQWDNAVGAFTEASNGSSPPGDVFYWLGIAAVVRGETENAAGLFQRALSNTPNHLEAQRALGSISNR